MATMEYYQILSLVNNKFYNVDLGWVEHFSKTQFDTLEQAKAALLNIDTKYEPIIQRWLPN